MGIKVGYAEGKCSRCGKKIVRRRPADTAVCDCYKYCPNDHGNGPYGTLMEEYIPEVTPSIYGPIESETAQGNIEHPMHIFYRCPICNYYSSQPPVEVELE